jgi:hypothetical protein
MLFSHSNNPPRLFYTMVKPSTTQSTSTKKSDFGNTYDNLKAARLGYAKVRLEWKAFTFGKYNPRPLNSKQVTKLVGMFATDGVRSMMPETLLPLVVPTASCVKMESLANAVDNVSELELTAEGKETIKQLELLSGQHRVKASIERRASLLDEKTTAEKSLKRAKGSEAVVLEDRIDELGELIAEVSYWGVAVYDDCKSVKILLF